MKMMTAGMGLMSIHLLLGKDYVVVSEALKIKKENILKDFHRIFETLLFFIFNEVFTFNEVFNYT